MYITLPAADPSYLHKAYVIKINGRQHSKVAGCAKAMGKSKWLKYSNFSSTVEIVNASTNKLIYKFGN